MLTNLADVGSGWYPTRSTSAFFTSRPRRLSRERLSTLEFELLPLSEQPGANVDVLAESMAGSPFFLSFSSRAVRKATLGRLVSGVLIPHADAR